MHSNSQALNYLSSKLQQGFSMTLREMFSSMKLPLQTWTQAAEAYNVIKQEFWLYVDVT